MIAGLILPSAESLRASRNDLSKQIGMYMKNKEIEKANEIKAIVSRNNERIAEIEPIVNELERKIKNTVKEIKLFVNQIVFSVSI